MSFCEAEDREQEMDDQRALNERLAKIEARLLRLEVNARLKRGGSAYDLNMLALTKRNRK